MKQKTLAGHNKNLRIRLDSENIQQKKNWKCSKFKKWLVRWGRWLFDEFHLLFFFFFNLRFLSRQTWNRRNTWGERKEEFTNSIGNDLWANLQRERDYRRSVVFVSASQPLLSAMDCRQLCVCVYIYIWIYLYLYYYILERVWWEDCTVVESWVKCNLNRSKFWHEKYWQPFSKPLTHLENGPGLEGRSLELIFFVFFFIYIYYDNV